MEFIPNTLGGWLVLAEYTQISGPDADQAHRSNQQDSCQSGELSDWIFNECRESQQSLIQGFQLATQMPSESQYEAESADL